MSSEKSISRTVYTGPLKGDPLTENELAVLLAIPRLAERVPNATMFRLPLGPDPAQGWVDVTFSEARSIIPRLAADWKSRLSNTNRAGDPTVGPGLTICLLVQPICHVMFHWLAFWALGCSVQVLSLSMDDDTIALYLNKSGCRVAVHSGISNERLEGIRASWNGMMVGLAEEEHAHQLALRVKQGQDDDDTVLPWPEPQRPDPAIIIHSSGSTGPAKLLRLSLYFYTIGLPSVQKSDATKDIRPHPSPFLLFSPPYWTSFMNGLFNQLVAGAPTAFPHVLDIAEFPSSRFIGWVRGLGAGGIVCAPRFIRDILASGSESDINSLQGLHNIIVGGSALDESTAALAEKYRLKLMNAFGCTEFGTLMLTNQPPFTQLRLLPGPSPLMLPISDTEPDGSRQVQFWFSRYISPRVAHLHAKGEVLLKFEPFPGEGPHKGEPAARLDDIFKEVRTGSQVSYIYLGRSDDLIKLAGRGGWDISASVYETELTSVIASHLASQANQTGLAVDAVQLFGNNRPCTALVIQLRSVAQAEAGGEIGRDLIEQLFNLVEQVNNKLNLGPHLRVDAQKRMLILTSEGSAYGSGVPRSGEDLPRLMVTHKHTLQRWKNVEVFGSWLDGLDHQCVDTKP